MGTRADFYIVKTKTGTPKWLGSIAWDGNEIGNVEEAKTKLQYLGRIKKFLNGRDDSTYPENGWPWPWRNSKITDECYVFVEDKNKIYRLIDYKGDHNDSAIPARFCPINVNYLDKEYDVKEIVRGEIEMVMPDMKEVMNVSFGKNSGLIVLSIPR